MATFQSPGWTFDVEGNDVAAFPLTYRTPPYAPLIQRLSRYWHNRRPAYDMEHNMKTRSFHSWLTKYNNDTWSISRPKDAQKLSLLWIPICALIIHLTWSVRPRPSGAL